MAWNYRRRIKIIPGIHLSLSKKGISTSIGIKGASVNAGKNGTWLDSGIPGTALYSRLKLTSGSSHQSDTLVHELPLPEPVNVPDVTGHNIFSADMYPITSKNMQGVKEAIMAAHRQRLELADDLKDVKKALSKSKDKLTWSYILLYGLINKSAAQKIKQEIAFQQEATRQIEEQIANSALQLDYEFDSEILNRYQLVRELFKKLSSCKKIWDLTNANENDRAKTRPAVAPVVSRREVQFGMKAIPAIKANFTPLYFQNGNGADLYFYPHFVIAYPGKEKLAIIGLQELAIDFTPVRFEETATVPWDSKIIDRTWAKVNKNGSPDTGFKDNYEIPVVRYGHISLKTSAGLHEQYQFSNYEACEAFVGALLTYQNLVKQIGER